MKKLLLASLALHGVLFAALLRSRTAPAPEARPQAETEVTLLPNENENESESEHAPLPVPDTDVAPPAEATEATDQKLAALATRRGGSEGAPAPAASTGGAAEPIAGSNSSWVVNPFALGVGSAAAQPAGIPNGTGGNPFGPTRQQMEGAERAFNTEKRKDNGLKGALAAADARKGLGPDGPVLRALEEETRSSLAPVRGNATFRAIVDATGTVTALHLLDTSGDRAGWNDARERAFAALQKKKLELRGTNGAMIDITIESELRYPSGQKAGGGPTASTSGITMGDLSDIGTHPQRVVHARLSNYTPL